MSEVAVMTKQDEMDFVYSTFDKLFRMSLGETPVFSGAKYDGDFSLSLDEAQRRKCEFIRDSLNLGRGSRVLDIGCGWGGWLKYLRDEVGADGVGVNLSSAQVASCQRNGLNAHLMDGRAIEPDTFGPLDALSAMGSPEHFCSVEQWRNGQQDQVYQRFFERAHRLVKPGSRIYIQAMVFGPNLPERDAFDIDAPRDSDEYICALMVEQFPDSWLPYGHEQLVRCAEPHFRVVSYSSGRLDYIETIRQWKRLWYRFGLKKYLTFLSLVPRYFTRPELRYQYRILRENPNQECFKREIMDHARLVFERID